MKILLLNQCFHPDVVSSAQHLTDLAVELARRGHAVTVLASDRGYDNPQSRFPRREQWKNITILRIPSLGLGKESRWRRALNFGSYIVSCFGRLALLPRFDLVLAMTSPPLISFLGALVARWRGSRFLFWVMDLNPDEAVAAGWLHPGSLVTRCLNRMLAYSLQVADRIVVLDRFMKQRLMQKGVAEQQLMVLPPWSHDSAVHFDPEGRDAFRRQHGLSEKFVVMYSGNHSPCHPLETVLQAAAELTTEPHIHFCFVGGGSEMNKVRAFVQQHGLKNILTLPYEPLERLSASLSAADLHLVVMGDPFVGLVHPCKIYNILAVGSPFLFIGPSESHVTDLLDWGLGIGSSCSFRHDQIEAIVAYLRRSSRMGRDRARVDSIAGNEFSQVNALPKLIGVVEALGHE